MSKVFRQGGCGRKKAEKEAGCEILLVNTLLMKLISVKRLMGSCLAIRPPFI